MAFLAECIRSSIQLSHPNHKSPESFHNYVANAKKPQVFSVGEAIEMLVLDIFREIRSPINAMEQCRNIRKVLILEIASIFFWIFVEILFVKLCLFISWLNAIFSIDRYDIDSSPMNWIIFGLNNFVKLCLLDMSNRQIFQDFQTSLSSPPSSSYCDDHRREFLWYFLFPNFLSNGFEMCVTICNIEVLV